MCDCRSHNGFLRAKGLKEAAQRFSFEGLLPLGGVAPGEEFSYLDKVGSVSGLRRDETVMIFNEGIIDEQYRRFLSSSEGG